MPEEFQLVERANGQVVKVYPDGRKYLVSPNDPILNLLNEKSEEHQAADALLQQSQFDAIAKKKEELDRGGLPPEKRPI